MYSTEINHNSLGTTLNSVAPSVPLFLCEGSQPLGCHGYSYHTWFSSVNSVLSVQGYRENYKVVKQIFELQTDIRGLHVRECCIYGGCGEREREGESERDRGAENIAVVSYDCVKSTSKLL